MFVLKDRTRLYLDSWNYNALLIISELARIVEGAGGRADRSGKTALISNRSVTSAHRVYSEKLAKLLEAEASRPSNSSRTTEINRLRKELEVLDSFDNSPIEVIGQNWIHFILDGKFYSLSFDDNPFMEFHYSKTPVKDNGEYSLDAYRNELDKSWLEDCYLTYKCTADDRELAADLIFNLLVDSRDSTIARFPHRKKVIGAHDRSYHWETVYEKERIAKLTF